MTLLQIVIILPLVLVLLTMTSSIVRNIVRAWMDHRVKLALLEQLERKPELLRSMDALKDLLDTTPDAETSERQIDYVITGSILAAVGLVCAILGGLFSGRQAVGVYMGGVICVVLGFLLAMVGLALRFLARSPVRPVKRVGWLRRWLGGGDDV